MKIFEILNNDTSFYDCESHASKKEDIDTKNIRTSPSEMSNNNSYIMNNESDIIVKNEMEIKMSHSAENFEKNLEEIKLKQKPTYMSNNEMINDSKSCNFNKNAKNVEIMMIHNTKSFDYVNEPKVYIYSIYIYN